MYQLKIDNNTLRTSENAIVVIELRVIKPNNNNNIAVHFLLCTNQLAKFHPKIKIMNVDMK